MTSHPAPGATLSAGLTHAAMTLRDLWLRYFALGGMAGPDHLRQIIDGTVTPSHRDYDLMAQAINEQFIDLGRDHPVPYADDIGL